ncbi:MAG: peptidoglycan-binding protein [Myxococcota bacterium]
MPERPEQMTAATAREVAAAFVVAADAADLAPTAELVGVLLAQSALETGKWAWMRNHNFGNIKATDAWVAAGNDFVFFNESPPHDVAPVTENMSPAQVAQARATSRLRTDGSGLPDMTVGPVQRDGRILCRFWASHIQTRFRSFPTLEAGASAYLGKFLGRYRGALDPARAGDVVGYVTALRDLGPYFTADFDGYLRLVQRLYDELIPVARDEFDFARPFLPGLPPPPPPGTPPSSSPPTQASPMTIASLPNTGAFRTRLDDIVIRDEGWERLPSGAWVTRLPLWDARYDLAARIGFVPVGGWMAARGMRLPTAGEMSDLHQAGHFVAPVTKVHRKSDIRHMMSHRWAAEHDAEVWRRLRAGGWNGADPVANFGKHWVAPSGTIFGWWTAAPPSEARIQNASTAHRGEPNYADYATTVHAAYDGDEPPLSIEVDDPGSHMRIEGWPPIVVTKVGDAGEAVRVLQSALRDRGYDPGPVDGHHGPKTERALQHARGDAYQRVRGPAAGLRIGLRRLHWMAAQFAIDPREVRGPEHHPLILSYSEHCRRGGRFLGVDDAGRPLWDGGVPLAAPSDEWAWCAAFVSAGLLAELRADDAVVPHGARVSVRELVEDARAAGTLRLASSGYVPIPGDLMISARIPGESPLRGGRGHVDALVQHLRDRPGWAETMGGNEAANLEHGGRIRWEAESLAKAEAYITDTVGVAA